MTSRSLRLAVGLVMMIALAARISHLGSIPTVFFHDECDNTVNAISILQGKGPGLFGLDWKPQPALAVNILAASLALTGPSVAAIRFPSAVFSVVALIPFFLLVRRVAGDYSALLATVLLAFHPGFLHFSRSGWENVQICLWTLLAMEAATRGETKGGFFWWALTGAAAALSSMTYFAGRATPVFLFLYIMARMIGQRDERARWMRGAVLMAIVFAVCVSPLLPTIWQNWDLFNRRTRAVSIVQELPEGAGVGDVAAQVLHSAARSVRGVYRGGVAQDSRYFNSDWPLLDPWESGLLCFGFIASVSRFRETALWWLALLVPFLFTQVLASHAPNLARGIAILPALFLFVALGMRSLEDFLVGRRLFLRLVFLLLVAWSAIQGTRNYFEWATSRKLASALQPAVELRDFRDWWDFQQRWIGENRGFFNVMMWQERVAKTRSHG